MAVLKVIEVLSNSDKSWEDLNLFMYKIKVQSLKMTK